MPTIVINKITAGFPHPTFDPSIGLPSYETIKDLHVQLNANAASIFSNLGDGHHGLLRLTVSDAQYNSVFRTTYESRTNCALCSECNSCVNQTSCRPT